MPFLPQGTEPLDELIALRLTAREKARLLENAGHAGLSLSEYVRRRTFGRRVLAETDAAMLRELRRLGGQLKHIHNESKGIYSQDTAKVLHSIKKYMEKLSSGRQKG